MFEKMDVSARLNDFGGFPYLRTHPLTVERIGEARARAGIVASASAVRRPARACSSTPSRRRARGCSMDPRVDALRRWQARDADNEGSAADKLRAACESALASSMLRDWARADAAFADALGDRPRQPEQQRARRACRRADASAVAARPRRARAGSRGDEGLRERRLAAERCCSTAQIALLATPAVSARQRAR